MRNRRRRIRSVAGIWSPFYKMDTDSWTWPHAKKSSYFAHRTCHRQSRTQMNRTMYCAYVIFVWITQLVNTKRISSIRARARIDWVLKFWFAILVKKKPIERFWSVAMRFTRRLGSFVKSARFIFLELNIN